MPGSPHRVFAEADEQKQELLKAIWPELYDALRPAVSRPWGCGFQHDDYVEVVARVWLNGPPACADHVRQMSKRPGGFPLKTIDPRKWRE